LILKYQEISSSELNRLIHLDPVIIIPNSPMEVHGPHLPLGSDIIQAENMARILAEAGNKKFPEKPWILFPAIPIGADPLPLDGSLNYGYHNLVGVLKSTGAGLLQAGIKSVIFTNFHGGMRHILAQDVAADYINSRGGKSFAPFGLLFGEFLQKEFSDKLNRLLKENGFDLEMETDIHAGAVETSLIMAIGNNVEPSYRDLKPLSFKNDSPRTAVVMEKLKNSLGGFSSRARDLFADLTLLFQASTHFKKHSYSGAPAKADPEIGRLLFNTFTEKLAEILEEFVRTSEIKGDKWKSIFWKNRRMVNNKVFDLAFSRILGNK
jgi:creatinine amidohydrolase